MSGFLFHAEDFRKSPETWVGTDGNTHYEVEAINGDFINITRATNAANSASPASHATIDGIALRIAVEA
jgi:hypothetical protein